MPLGAFRLNSLAKLSLPSTPAQEYFILYTTSRDDSYTVVADSNNDIYALTNSHWVYKITESGSVSWSKTMTSTFNDSGNEIFLVNDTLIRYPIVWSYYNSVTYPYGYVSLNTSDGSVASYKSERSSSNNSGYGNTGNTPSVYTDGTNEVYYYRGQNNFYQRNLCQSGTTIKALFNGDNSSTSGVLKFSDGNITVAAGNTLLTMNSALTSTVSHYTIGSVIYGIKKLSTQDMIVGAGNKVAKMSPNSLSSTSWCKQLSVGSISDRRMFAVDSNDNTFIAVVTTSVIYVYKIDSTGTLAAKMKITVNTNTASQVKMNVCNDNVYITGVGQVTGTTAGAFIIKLPNDLSTTGTYGNFNFSAGTHSITGTSFTHSSVTNITFETVSRGSVTQTITQGTPTSVTFSKSIT